ncbi:GNAT family N-acetyltransferase [Anabaena aphanizomenioides LEGE 00250]|uniref:GNAT family N-acetyltransferase n=1 Tax=Sphaerospermopsis aphanizomenoides LEGE 00250 TaxID=2777972 RepID=A0ABR9VFP6_9CYAN|nr:GNAT family N-acetyltransferase [Sphaerospermopsis aphanizomenoides]MBE9237323.1 GNAT family N-acetyltransferase [Sphaerospermopsis aphanizomenoides LEGE 00250]
MSSADTIQIYHRNNLHNILPDLKELLDICYPQPPQNVFYLLVEEYRRGFPVYIAIENSGKVIGFTYLAPNSKGGTLESLAVHPDFRNQNLGSELVNTLLKENKGVIQITTRIPRFFEKLGFQYIQVLPDQSHYMIILNFQ